MDIHWEESDVRSQDSKQEALETKEMLVVAVSVKPLNVDWEIS